MTKLRSNPKGAEGVLAGWLLVKSESEGGAWKKRQLLALPKNGKRGWVDSLKH